MDAPPGSAIVDFQNFKFSVNSWVIVCISNYYILNVLIWKFLKNKPCTDS